MKKIIVVLLMFLGLIISAHSENIKMKIGGSEDSYNQIKIINYTDYDDFNCTVYLLEKRGEKFIVKETLGVLHLRFKNDSDTCSVTLMRNSYIGISFSKDLGGLSYVVTYRDIPFFDAVEIYISEKTEFENAVGNEFH